VSLHYDGAHAIINSVINTIIDRLPARK